MKNEIRGVIIGKIKWIERIKSSINGNPRYKILVDVNGKKLIEFITMVDSSVGIRMKKNWTGKNVEITWKKLYKKNAIESIQEI